MIKPWVILVLHLMILTTVASTKTADESLVDYYEEWYNRRSVEALNYEFPTDARMYETANENPEGKNNFQYNS